ncbi:MAG: hypothetical protein H7210_00285 [Pyrinomonadaceae bacterium]|nr:hypothetical protein [Phycisphaerales bacterium]
MFPGPDKQVPLHSPHAGLWSRSLYLEAKQIARLLLSNRRHGDSLSPTMMVHETFVRLERSGIRSLPEDECTQRIAFFALVRRVMRSVIVDWIRRRISRRRSTAVRSVRIDDAAIDAHAFGATDPKAEEWQSGEDLAAAMRDLEQIDARKALVVEFRCLRGMSTPQIATALGVCERTVELDWAGAKVWLKRQITCNRNLG